MNNIFWGVLGRWPQYRYSTVDYVFIPKIVLVRLASLTVRALWSDSMKLMSESLMKTTGRLGLQSGQMDGMDASLG